jgi:hypothetical protein
MDLEVTEREGAVGNFSVDLLATDLVGGVVGIKRCRV